MRVVATAGHVDHGKSTLVHALTGTDPDRFPEEHARGLTIDLGFAFCTLPSGTELGFVDVPGHTRFIKNMLAGVGAVDVAVLVVAANEGWKPQSEEHLRILDLLAVGHGVVVITKADLVDGETLEIARLEVADHLAGTSLADAETVTCDARSGRGLDDVLAALDRVIGAAPPARDVGRPRLWVDRVFAAKGAGTVVTGTLTGGTIRTEDELEVADHAVRVRGIEQHGARVAQAAPGERVALNLVGVDHHAIARGDAVRHAVQWWETEVADVELTVLPGATVKRRSRLRAAVGSGEHDAWCRRLDDRFARLRFDRALPLAPGDRIVLRDTGTATTIAGAEVLDVAPTTRAADAPTRLELPLPERLLASGWLALDGLDARAGLPLDVVVPLLVDSGAEQLGSWLVPAGDAAATREAVRTRVAAHHRDHPDDAGPAFGDVAREVGLDPERLAALVATMPTLAVERGILHHADHAGRVADTEQARSLVAALDASPFAPPLPENRALVRALAREGIVVELDGLVFSAAALARAKDLVVAALAARGSLTVADARDVLGSTRKFVVPIMGHLDATGVTRRRGDDRIPGPRSGIPGSE